MKSKLIFKSELFKLIKISLWDLRHESDDIATLIVNVMKLILAIIFDIILLPFFLLYSIKIIKKVC